MKPKTLIVISVVLTLTSASQETSQEGQEGFFDAFYRGQATPIGYGNLAKTKKFQMAKLAEENLANILSGGKTDQCLQRSLCAIGAVSKTTSWPRHSLGKGLSLFSQTLQKIHSDVGDFTDFSEHFPKIDQAIANFEVGKVAKRQELCDQLYVCPITSTEILKRINYETKASDFENAQDSVGGIEARSTCQAAGKLCPGISIGCALCGVFLPGTCGDQCIVAGIYCGVSALACKKS